MARDLDEDQRARLDAEWAFLNATREMMNIARRKPDGTTYNQATHLGEAIAPGVMDPNKRLILGLKDSNEARYYRQKALAESELQGRYVSPLEVIEKDIKELTSQASVAPDAEALHSRLTLLKKIRQELKPKKITEH